MSVLLYMFPVFFSWGSPSFQIYSALCFCVVLGAGASVLSLLVMAFGRRCIVSVATAVWIFSDVDGVD